VFGHIILVLHVALVVVFDGDNHDYGTVGRVIVIQLGWARIEDNLFV
jgi:hypothetical protein